MCIFIWYFLGYRANDWFLQSIVYGPERSWIFYILKININTKVRLRIRLPAVCVHGNYIFKLLPESTQNTFICSHIYGCGDSAGSGTWGKAIVSIACEKKAQVTDHTPNKIIAFFWVFISE